MVEILKDRPLMFSESDGFWVAVNDEGTGMYLTDGVFTLTEGETYTIVINGVEYTGEAVTATVSNLGEVVGIGNAEALSGGEGNGEPYAAGFAQASETASAFVFIWFDTATAAEAYTVSLYEGVQEEETPGANIVLYDRNGAAVTYEGIETVSFNTDVDGEIATYTYGTATDEVSVTLDLSTGNQTVTPTETDLMRKAVIQKPETLTPENIRRNVEIAGVTGTLTGEGVSKEITLNLAEGNQTVAADTDTLMSEVVIQKPETLLPGNIAKGVDIAGVVGTLESGGGEGTDLVKYVTFLNEDGTQLFKMPVLVGDDCKDPVSHGDIDTPTKESTNTQVFTHSGWTSTVGGTADSDILKNITADKTVYVAYAVSTRYYTVRFYANDALFETVQVTYGGTATPSKTPTKDGYSFSNWEPSPTNVTADMECYAVWVDEITFAGATWAKISEICEAGQAAQYFSVGDKKQITVDGESKTYYAIIIGINHDDKADDSGKAGITCRFSDTVNTGYTTASYTNGRWETRKLRTEFYATTLPSKLEQELVSVVKPVKKQTESTNNFVIDYTTETFWNLSLKECRFSGFDSEKASYYPIFTKSKNANSTTSYEDLSLSDEVGGYVDTFSIRTNHASSSSTSAYYIEATSSGGTKKTTTAVQPNQMPCFCI